MSIIAARWRWPTRSKPIGNWPSGAASRSSSIEYRDELDRRFWSSTPTTNGPGSALGHQEARRRLESRDEVMAARGLVWYDGKYYTQQHIELLEQAKAVKQTRRRLEQPARSLAALAHRPAAGSLRRSLRRDSGDQGSGGRAGRRRAVGRGKEPGRQATADGRGRPDGARRWCSTRWCRSRSPIRTKTSATRRCDHLIATGRPGLIGPYVAGAAKQRQRDREPRGRSARHDRRPRRDRPADRRAGDQAQGRRRRRHRQTSTPTRSRPRAARR